MPQRTQLFKLMPWNGGLNDRLDPSLIPSNQLSAADNITFGLRTSRGPREGIDFHWDGSSNGTASVIGEHDFWYGTSTKTQKIVSIMSDGTMYSYVAGVRTQLTVKGQAWTAPLTSASFVTIGNYVLVAVSGANNNVKFWDGTNAVQDLYSRYNNTTVSRSSSGTTRTIVFGQAFGGANGSTVVVTGMGNANYLGTFTVASLSTTNVSNDTITYTATGSLSESTTADTAGSVGKVAPSGSVLREHLQRIFMNDKTSLDRLNYSPTGDPFLWFGFGDSGAVPVGEGDGDPIGITSLFPTFKGTFFIGKQTKLWRMDGLVPEFWQFTKISDGIGCVSHNSIAPVDQDDVVFVSLKGVHSLNATNSYGDFESQYVSYDIQGTFNNLLNKAQLPYTWAAYDPNLNSVAFTFAGVGSSTNNHIYLYNIPNKAWYRWPNISCQSLILANDADRQRFYIGSSTSRVAKTQTSNIFDINAAGTHVNIPYVVTTGQIYVDDSPYTTKAFKRIIVFFKPVGTYVVTCNVTIDNHPLNSENSVAFIQSNAASILGSTFTLGSSLLGSSALVLIPNIASIDGYGRSVTISITQTGVTQSIDIQGIAIEYEPAGTSPEAYTV